MGERHLHVLGKARCENVLLRTELVSRLADYRVDNVNSGHFVLRLALLNELLNALHHVLVKLDRLHGRPGDGGHLRLRNRRLVLVQARELEWRRRNYFTITTCDHYCGVGGWTKRVGSSVGRSLRAPKGFISGPRLVHLAEARGESQSRMELQMYLCVENAHCVHFEALPSRLCFTLQ